MLQVFPKIYTINCSVIYDEEQDDYYLETNDSVDTVENIYNLVQAGTPVFLTLNNSTDICFQKITIPLYVVYYVPDDLENRSVCLFAGLDDDWSIEVNADGVVNGGTR